LKLDLAVVKTGDLDPQAKAEIVSMCTRAFGKDFSSLFHFVQAADHVLARLDGRLVGHAIWGARFLQAAGSDLLRTAYVDAVATDRDLWGKGVGRSVMNRLTAETTSYDLRALGTDDVPGFYEALGWERWLGALGVRTEEGMQLTPGEIVFVQRTPSTPALDLRSLLTVEPRGGSHGW
jgi:aminoglycoside 2'-N-acetyltransferase I